MNTNKSINYSKAYWLVRNTGLTFHQIAEYCQLHILEVMAIEEGTSKMCTTGYDLVAHGELTKEEIIACEQDSTTRLINKNIVTKKKSPVSRRKPLL